MTTPITDETLDAILATVADAQDRLVALAETTRGATIKISEPVTMGWLSGCSHGAYPDGGTARTVTVVFGRRPWPGAKIPAVPRTTDLISEIGLGHAATFGSGPEHAKTPAMSVTVTLPERDTMRALLDRWLTDEVVVAKFYTGRNTSPFVSAKTDGTFREGLHG